MSKSSGQAMMEYDAAASAVAGLGSRFLAALIDTAIVAVACAVLTGAPWLNIRGGSAVSADPVAELLSQLATGATLISLLLILGYYISFEMLWHGQSPGKRWAGLRVLRHTGHPMRLQDSVARNLLRIVDFLPVCYVLGALSIVADSHSRRLGDIVARTLVVKVPRQSQRTAAQSFPAHRAHPEDLFVVPHAERLTPDDVKLIRSFLDRRYTLTPLRRADLARQISDHMMTKLETHEVIYDREAFLEQVDALEHSV